MPHRAALLALLLCAAACSERAAPDALHTARAVLGPGVRAAVRFRAGELSWIAAARESPGAAPDPVTREPRDPAAWEVVLLGEPGTPPLATGLLVRGADPGRLWGVADADGDGWPEVWAAQVAGERLDLRVHAPRGGALYRVVVPLRRGGMDHAQREFSFNVMDSPALQRWLTARAESIAAARP